MATILIGSKTLGAAILAPLEKKGFATKRECLVSGQLHELGLATEAASKSEGIKLGIRKDEAGAVGAFIAETAEIPLVKETAQEVKAVLEGGDVALTAGTVYWLCVISTKGTSLKFKATEKAGFGFKTTAAVSKVSEGTWTTAENKFGEPAPIWGEGEPSGPSPVWNFQPPTFGTPKGLYKPFPPPPSAQQLLEEFLTAQLKGQITLKDTLTGQTNISVGAIATYRFADKASIQVMSQSQALSRLTFVDAATPNAIMQAQVRAKILLVDGANAQQILQVAGKARFVFAGEAKAVEAGTPTGKKVTIFIFED